MKYILPKGFVAVDGISLTVGEVGENSFCVYLIPETLRVTTLGVRKEGDAVNIEIEAQTQVASKCFTCQCALMLPERVAGRMHLGMEELEVEVGRRRGVPCQEVKCRCKTCRGEA